MASPLIVRDGSARSVKLGPDEWTFLAAGHDTGDRFDVIRAAISHLEGPPLHVHRDQDDTFVVLEGTLKVQVGDEITDLYPGDLVSAPRGTPHTFTNVTNDLVHVLNIMTPGGLDRCLTDFAALMNGMTDSEEFGRVANRHGIEVVGPPLRVTLGLGESGSS
jgi:mannose-6-phosphate isomerase-like protein (cupin superfamily)